MRRKSVTIVHDCIYGTEGEEIEKIPSHALSLTEKGNFKTRPSDRTRLIYLGRYVFFGNDTVL